MRTGSFPNAFRIQIHLLILLTVLAGPFVARAAVTPPPEVPAEPPLAAELTAALPAGQQLTGLLNLVWGDPQRAGAPPLFQALLTLADGRRVALQFERLSPNELVPWNGAYVTVDLATEVVPPSRPDGVLPVVVAGLRVAAPDELRGLALPAPAPELAGSIPWVTVLCKFADYPTESQPLTFFQGMYGSQYPLLDHYWQELSDNQINLQGSAAFGWYALPNPRSYYITSQANLTALANDCTAQAEPDIYFPSFSGIHLVFNANLDGYARGGIWSMTLDGVSRYWRVTWLPPWAWSNLSVIEHEMGHGFGLPHSSGEYGATYDNVWDVMSADRANCSLNQDPVYGCLGQHTIAFHKNMLNWIPADQVFTVPEGVELSFNLGRLALPQTGDTRLARIPIWGHSDFYYTLEARRKVGYDFKLPGEAVIIHRVENNYAHVIDVDWNGYTGDGGAMWLPGETFIAPEGGITVTVNAALPSGGFSVTVETAALGEFACSTQTQVPLDECQALEALYNANNGPNWLRNQGWLINPGVCYWDGIRCADGHVVEISLYNNQLSGPLTPRIGDFPELRRLYLSTNGLTGSLPPELGQLTHLNDLDLASNDFTGGFPLALTGLSELQRLFMGYNQLTGPLPAETGNLTSLQELRLYGNQFSGALPPELGDLPNLKVLWADNNQFAGPIPPELGNATALEEIYLGYNQLTGPLPASLGNLTNLRQLNLTNNLLDGSLPAEFGNLSVLERLAVNGNQLTGPLPASLGDLANLDSLFLYDNQLSGPLPASLGNLARLRWLELYNNQLTGSLPASLGNLGQLKSLRLDNNLLEGPIPPELGQAHNLNTLYLQGNRLTGSLPAALGNLSNLRRLRVDFNALSGEYPVGNHQPEQLVCGILGHQLQLQPADGIRSGRLRLPERNRPRLALQPDHPTHQRQSQRAGGRRPAQLAADRLHLG